MVSTTTMFTDRASRCAMLRAVRILRQSVRNRRPISLPNFRRLYLRFHAKGEPGIPSALEISRLESWYRLGQPFREIPRL